MSEHLFENDLCRGIPWGVSGLDYEDFRCFVMVMWKMISPFLEKRHSLGRTISPSVLPQPPHASPARFAGLPYLIARMEIAVEQEEEIVEDRVSSLVASYIDIHTVMYLVNSLITSVRCADPISHSTCSVTSCDHHSHSSLPKT